LPSGLINIYRIYKYIDSDIRIKYFILGVEEAPLHSKLDKGGNESQPEMNYLTVPHFMSPPQMIYASGL
jgi:hypothetical protein